MTLETQDRLAVFTRGDAVDLLSARALGLMQGGLDAQHELRSFFARLVGRDAGAESAIQTLFALNEKSLYEFMRAHEIRVWEAQNEFVFFQTRGAIRKPDIADQEFGETFQKMVRLFAAVLFVVGSKMIQIQDAKRDWVTVAAGTAQVAFQHPFKTLAVHDAGDGVTFRVLFNISPFFAERAHDKKHEDVEGKKSGQYPGRGVVWIFQIRARDVNPDSISSERGCDGDLLKRAFKTLKVISLPAEFEVVEFHGRIIP